MLSTLFNIGDLEHWDEMDSDIVTDFPSYLCTSSTNEQKNPDELLNQDEQAIIWWVVAFSCVFQTLHSLSSRAVAWLLNFLGALLSFLGLYSNDIAKIALAFPSTLYRRSQYLQGKIFVASVCNYVVCPACLNLFKYEHCLEKRATQTAIKSCSQCERQARKKVPLLKEIVLRSGKKKCYPFSVFPNACLVSSLKSLISRPGFYESCDHWRHDFVRNSSCFSDVYSGRLWNDFLQFDGQPFLSSRNNIALMLNIDWFQPFKHRVYSIGVIYLAIMNLPREIRFKRENILLVGLIPGPSEPSLTINTYLTPLVADLLTLWDGVTVSTCDSGQQVIRCALLCLGCDLPAGRKVSGFLSYSANLGCSRCYSNFGTGVFGKQDYSGFDRAQWVPRTVEKHRDDIKAILQCSTKTERKHKESEFGCRYSCLLQLPYFDVVRMLIIDPMHNLYLGTAKHLFSRIWVKRDILDTSSLNTINERISLLRVPPEVRFNRLPACMDNSSSLTAEQWMLWVNYYSLYCLYELIPTQHIECWRLFVLASRLLCKTCITGEDVELADALLLRFCKKFQSLYGPDSVTPNIHLHAHLVDCVRDYGPMSSFWLFSFERYNGILGDEPTNNRSIEVQLMDRFMKDNAHLQLLSSVPSASSNITSAFSRAVLEHACSFTSTRHLDAVASRSQIGRFSPAPKHTISSFSKLEVNILRNVYSKVYPSLLLADLFIPQTFKKMAYVTIDGQRVNNGQYILARNVFRFSSSGVCTFSLGVRPAKVDYIFMHSIQVDDSNCINDMFAAVSWPMHHPLQHTLGKPYEVWCVTAFESSNENLFVPLSTNYLTLLLTAKQTIHNQDVLVTVPLIL